MLTQKMAGEPQRKRQRTFARQQKAAERVASATSQVASGIAEAASACEELRRAMEQIATGAEEAASAAEESQRAMTRIAASNKQASDTAEMSQRKTDALQGLLGTVSTQIAQSIVSVGRAAERQVASVDMMTELDKQAANIGDIVKAVARIADPDQFIGLERGDRGGAGGPAWQGLRRGGR